MRFQEKGGIFQKVTVLGGLVDYHNRIRGEKRFRQWSSALGRRAPSLRILLRPILPVKRRKRNQVVRRATAKGVGLT